MALKSRICEILGIEYPILLAGMGGASVPALAAAVSNAGGLGVLGAAACSPDQLRKWIRQTRELTDKPFGVDTLLPASVRRGSAPQETGAKMLIFEDGAGWGTVGGGYLEALVQREAAGALSSGSPRLIKVDLVENEEGEGGVCGGSVEVFIDVWSGSEEGAG